MKLKPFVDGQGNFLGYHHYCPGCESNHGIWTEARNSRGATWSFDGNMESPTFSPSIKVTYNGADAGQTDEDGFKSPPEVCHYFIRNGMIEFCGDSTHSLAGKTVPLPEWKSSL